MITAQKVRMVIIVILFAIAFGLAFAQPAQAGFWNWVNPQCWGVSYCGGGRMK
jgi:hypothetical protein